MARNNRRQEYADTGGYEDPLKPSRPSKPNRPSRETGGDRKPPRPTPPLALNPDKSEDDSFYTHPGTVGIVNPLKPPTQVKPPAPAEEEEAPVYTYTPPPSPTPSPTPSPVTISETPQQTAQQTAVPATGTPTPLLVKPPQGNISQAEREGIATSPTPTAPGTSGYFYRPTPAPAPTPEASFTTDGGRSDADAYSYASERQAERQLQRSEERDRQAATPTGFDRFRQNGQTGSSVIQTLINSFAAKPVSAAQPSGRHSDVPQASPMGQAAQSEGRSDFRYEPLPYTLGGKATPPLDRTMYPIEAYGATPVQQALTAQALERFGLSRPPVLQPRTQGQAAQAYFNNEPLGYTMLGLSSPPILNLNASGQEREPTTVQLPQMSPGPEALRERTDAFVQAANPPGAVLPARLSDPDDDSFYTHPGAVGTVNTQGAQAPINTVNSTAPVNPATPVQPSTTPFGQSPLTPPPAQAEIPVGATYQWNRTPDGWLHPTKIALEPTKVTPTTIKPEVPSVTTSQSDEVWDGKVPEGAQVFKPAYGQTDENGNPMKGIKLPYRPEGYTEEELKFFKQVPARYDPHGKDTNRFFGSAKGFEGYYYHNGKYYPIDAKKAAEYFGRGRAERTGGGGGGHGSGPGAGGNANSGSSGSGPGKIQELDQYYNINKNWSF